MGEGDPRPPRPAAIEHAAKELYLLTQPGLQGVMFHGPTMLPFLRDGDHLVIRPVEWHRIRPGDIITYRDAGKFPTCRVTSRTSDAVTLRADNWAPFRMTIGEDDVVGRVEQRERDGARLSRGSWTWRFYTLRSLAVGRYRAWRRRWRNRARAV